MLEGLSKINWEKIRHRNGSASNIPPLLWKLNSKVQKEQNQSVHELFSHICYRGKVYEATARVVPFLYEILESRACSERFAVLWLLGAIAGVRFRQEGLHEDRPEMIWSQNAHSAVRQGVKPVLRLLNESDKNLRLPAVLLLVTLPEESAQIKPVLLAVLSAESNPDIRAALGLALALLGFYHVGAFEDGSQKIPVSLANDMAKACLQNKKMTLFACKTIEECFMETLESQDQDWLRHERGLFDNLNFYHAPD